MSAFPNTPTALLTKIAANASGEDETLWVELVELYQPAMRGFLMRHGVAEDEADDIAQDVFAKLVGILREGRFDRRRGLFRSYLATLLYHELIGRIRKSRVRMVDRYGPLTEDAAVVPPVAPGVVEAGWLAECHAVAVKHILERTALSESSKRVFCELEESGDTCETVAKRLGVSAASVRQVKSRISRMVQALEKRMLGDEK